MADYTAFPGDDATPAEAEVASALGLSSAAELGQLRARVLAILRGELKDNALADDLCHEAFRIVLERLARQPLEHPLHLDSYLHQTARFLVIRHRKRAARQRTSTGQQAAIEGFADSQDHEFERQIEARAKAVRQVLKELRWPRDREILVRVYLHDQDKETVCRELGISDQHYKRVLHRARERFAELLRSRFRLSDLFCIALF
ncbi:MAG: RNA polymerase sigma factor [Gammaproteobacteria bacterium]